MRTLRKCSLNLIFLITLSLVFLNAKAVEVSCNWFNSWWNSCDSCFSERFYLNQQFDLWDYFNNKSSWKPEVVFSNSSSSVNIQTMWNLSLNNWTTTNISLVSSFSPSWKDRVVVFNPRWLKFTNTPTNRDTVAARAIYTLWYSVWWAKSLNSTWTYTDWVETTTWGSKNLTTTVWSQVWVKYFDLPPQNIHRECQNIYVSWCWDWVKDSVEACDPNDVNKNWWWIWWCSNTCQPITTPTSCLVWSVSWVQNSAISSTTAWLCQPWLTVWNFTSTLSWATTNYAWSCGWIWWWSCNASYTPVITPPTSCVSWWVTWTLTSPITSASSWLCQTWVTVWNFTNTLSWTTTNYSWSCNWVWWWNCNARITPTSCLVWSITWTQSWPISQSTPWLCQLWLAVWNFQAVTNWSVINYTWSCGWVWWWSCNASYSPGWWWTSPCVSWWVTWWQNSAINSSTPWLCISWTTVWNFSSVTNWSVINYTWECNWRTWWNCSASFTSWWWGWWWACTSWWVTWSQNSPISSTTNWLCTPWNVVWNFQSTANWSVINYTWSCSWRTWWNCLASYSSGWWWWNPPGWWWTPPGWWWTPPFCWDWILQRNTQWINEECDFWSWTWANWCTTTCTILKTTPSWGNISITPTWSLLIWHWMNVFANLNSSNISIKNTSTSDIYIDTPLCVYKTNISYNVLSWPSWICSSGDIWYLNRNWWTKSVNLTTSSYIWNTWNLPSWVDYSDAIITTTLQWLNTSNTFLKSDLLVRVAKPSVVTLWWWASILSWNNYSDINNVSSWWFSLLNPTVNKNLILSSLWVNPLSSYVKTSSDVNIITKSKTDWNKDLDRFNDISSNNWVSNITTLPSQKFNWFDDVFTHKWNVSLNAQNISWWNKTYIIEDWDLTINWDITSSSSILFVVKNWKIIIKNTVSNIDAIIINIWWKVEWDSVYTLNKLVINWALYWDVDDLLTKRTYIKDRWAYVDVWTMVNFTSKVFTSPPPLLSKFLWEYSNLDKIPK